MFEITSCYLSKPRQTFRNVVNAVFVQQTMKIVSWPQINWFACNLKYVKCVALHSGSQACGCFVMSNGVAMGRVYSVFFQCWVPASARPRETYWLRRLHEFPERAWHIPGFCVTSIFLIVRLGGATKNIMPYAGFWASIVLAGIGPITFEWQCLPCSKDLNLPSSAGTTEATSDEQLAFKQKERELAKYTQKVRPRSVEFLHNSFDRNLLSKKHQKALQ